MPIKVLLIFQKYYDTLKRLQIQLNKNITTHVFYNSKNTLCLYTCVCENIQGFVAGFLKTGVFFVQDFKKSCTFLFLGDVFMKIILFAIVLFLSFFLGVFGFCQIVGTIKYFKNFNFLSALITLIIWVAILGFGFYAVTNWLPSCKTALYIGYGISFILSLGTKPD